MATLHLILVYLHVMAAMGIFATLGIESVAMQRFRAANTPVQTRSAIDMMKVVRRVGTPSMLVMLITGIWMMIQWWGMWAWLETALGGVILMAITGGVLMRRGMQRIGPALAREEGTVLSEGFRLLQRSVELKLSLWLRIAVATGIVALMVFKPQLAASLVILSAAIAIGTILGLRSHDAVRAEAGLATEDAPSTINWKGTRS